MGLNCEPTNLCEINMATKGVYRVDVEIIGKGAFNARPYLGISAIDKAAKFIMAIQDLHEKISHDPAYVHPLLAPRSVQVAMINGGEASNLVPDRVKMTVTRRMHPGETEEQCYQDYMDIIERLHDEDPEFKAVIHPWEGFRPPVEVPMDTPIVCAIKKAQKLVLGTEPALTGSEGGTDASHVVAQTGIPMPVYGPGDHRLLGTAEEYVKVDVVGEKTEGRAYPNLEIFAFEEKHSYTCSDYCKSCRISRHRKRFICVFARVLHFLKV